MNRRHRVGEAPRAEEGRPVMPRQGGNRGGGGRAVAARVEDDGSVTPHRGGSWGGGGRAVVVGVWSSRAAVVGRRRATASVGSNWVVAVGRRRVTADGRAGWGGGGNNSSGRASGLGEGERVWAHTGPGTGARRLSPYLVSTPRQPMEVE
jgi:hypothetical protein